MLIPPDTTTYIEKLKRIEFAFPTNQPSDYFVFESRLPGAEVITASVLDPSISMSIDSGIFAVAQAQMQNLTKAFQLSIFETAQNIGIPDELKSAGTLVYDFFTIASNSILKSEKDLDDPLGTGFQLAKNSGLALLSAVAALAGGIIGIAVAAAANVANYVGGVIAAAQRDALGKDVILPPLQTADPRVDSWEVNRALAHMRLPSDFEAILPNGQTQILKTADYTTFILPRFKGEPTFQWREKGMALQCGAKSTVNVFNNPNVSILFNPTGNFGFMPGLETCLSVLQSDYKFYYTVRGVDVGPYNLICKGVDENCWETKSGFKGDRDCRQCVDRESVWPSKGIGWAYGGAPINATTPGVNVGDFYPNLNQLILMQIQQATKPSPMSFVFDWELALSEWENHIGALLEWLRYAWGKFSGYGWRGQLSRLASFITAYETKENGWQAGGRIPEMPLSKILDPTQSTFQIAYENTIAPRIIKPFCLYGGAIQRDYLKTPRIAYLNPTAGAFKRKGSQMAQLFTKNRAELLQSNARMEVYLRNVQDSEYRALLEQHGVKMPITNPVLGDTGHPIMAPIPMRKAPPRRMMPPLQTIVDFEKLQKPARAKSNDSQTTEIPWDYIAYGVGAAGMLSLASVAATKIIRTRTKRNR